MSSSRFTIFALFYGNHPELAERCLTSILRRTDKQDRDLRVGMNDCCAATQELVTALVPAGEIRQASIYNCPENIHKYPLMRRMFNDPANPITTPYVMWFDDDSYLKPAAEYNGTPWLDAVAIMMANHDLIGAVYSLAYRTNQVNWIKAQSWYAGKPMHRSRTGRGYKSQFVTGGWWTIRAAVLKRFDYPWAALDHNGGDVMLGELCNQQRLRVGRFSAGVAVNADANGIESKAARRGFSQRPIGYYYGQESVVSVAAPEPAPPEPIPPPPPDPPKPMRRRLNLGL